MGKLITIAQAAETLGLSREAVYKAVKAGRLKARKRGGRQVVNLEHARAALGKVDTPPRDPAPDKASPRVDALLAQAGSPDLDELLRAKVLDGAAADEVRALAQAATALQRRREAEAKAAKMITPADAAAMLRNLGAIFCEQIDANAGAFSLELLEVLRSEYAFQSSNPTVAQRIENVLREQANVVLDRLRTYITDEGAKLTNQQPGAEPPKAEAAANG